MNNAHQMNGHAFSFVEWNDKDFPEDGRTVLLLGIDGRINFARYEPECGQELKIVSLLGATRLGNFLPNCLWAEIPAVTKIIERIE